MFLLHYHLHICTLWVSCCISITTKHFRRCHGAEQLDHKTNTRFIKIPYFTPLVGDIGDVLARCQSSSRCIVSGDALSIRILVQGVQHTAQVSPGQCYQLTSNHTNSGPRITSSS